MQNELETARVFFEQSLQLKRLVGDKQGVSYALGKLASIAGQQADLALKKAAVAGCLVRDSRDPRASLAWADATALAQEILN